MTPMPSSSTTNGGSERRLSSQRSESLGALGAGPLTATQLAGFDQFHIRGLAATVELAELMGVKRDDLVLDAGSGIGGPSRYLAETFGCPVIGVDLAPSFVAVAQLLADRSGLRDRLEYQVGNLLDLNFPDEHFDIVYTQHVVMNIRDRDRLYQGIRRVLKTGRYIRFL